MTTYAEIKTGIVDVLSASNDLAMIYPEPQDRIITPSAQILPGNPIVEYYQTLQNGLNLFRFVILVCVQRFETMSSISFLDPLIYGPDSIRALIAADETLNGYASAAIVTRCSNLGMVQSGEEAFLGAEFDLEVYV